VGALQRHDDALRETQRPLLPRPDGPPAAAAASAVGCLSWGGVESGGCREESVCVREGGEGGGGGWLFDGGVLVGDEGLHRAVRAKAVLHSLKLELIVLCLGSSSLFMILVGGWVGG